MLDDPGNEEEMHAMSSIISDILKNMQPHLIPLPNKVYQAIQQQIQCKSTLFRNEETNFYFTHTQIG